MDATWAYLEADQAILTRIFPPALHARGDTMFDTLTRDEAYMLRSKLASGADKFFQVGQTLADVALADYGSPDHAVLWNRATAYYGLMHELADARRDMDGLVAR